MSDVHQAITYSVSIPIRLTAFDIVDRNSAREIASWLPINAGGKEGALAFAQKVNALTTWIGFDDLARGQQAGIIISVRELLVATIKEYEARARATNENEEPKKGHRKKSSTNKPSS